MDKVIRYKLHPKFKNITQLKHAVNSTSLGGNQFTVWNMNHMKYAHQLLNSKMYVYSYGDSHWYRYKNSYWHKSLFVSEDEYETFYNKYMYLKKLEKNSNEQGLD